ncbi:hypothetical protein M3J09_011201 [Ascochyta lentis]
MLTWYPLQPVLSILVFGRPFSFLALVWALSSQRMKILVKSSASLLDSTVNSHTLARVYDSAQIGRG